MVQMKMDDNERISQIFVKKKEIHFIRNIQKLMLLQKTITSLKPAVSVLSRNFDQEEMEELAGGEIQEDQLE
jgi:hypothetical protein